VADEWEHSHKSQVDDLEKFRRKPALPSFFESQLDDQFVEEPLENDIIAHN
jgi:hypothetical protein